MPTDACPSVAELTVSALSLALLTMLVAGMVGHGILRPQLEARGVTPWQLRDSLGSMPVVLIGSGLLGGAGTLLAIWGATGCDVGGAKVAAASIALLAATVMIRVGLIALQKLH